MLENRLDKLQDDKYQKIKQGLYNKALATIEQNIQHTQEGKFVSAGKHQFKTLWVRDFCYSVPGLLQAGYVELVENQLKLIFKYRKKLDEDAVLIARGIDVTDPKIRVLWNTFFRNIEYPKSYKNYSLTPEYLGEHKTPAYDSNLLFLRACFQLMTFTGKNFLLNPEQVKALISFYKTNQKGLFTQPSFSDWQDSAKRNGPLLLTHVLYLEVLVKINTLFPSLITDFKSESFEKIIIENFFDAKKYLFVEDLGRDKNEPSQYSLDSHAFILSNKDLLSQIDKNKLYANLKESPLWKNHLIPGIPVYPEHISKNVSWTTKAVGLRHYHDGFHWGWLAAEAFKLTQIYNDPTEGNKIIDVFNQANMSLDFLAEIYNAQDGKLMPQGNWIYKSECPFTWTAAKWIEALSV